MTVSDGIVIFYGVVILLCVAGLRDVSKRVKTITVTFWEKARKDGE